jgi:hypothetical protein
VELLEADQAEGRRAGEPILHSPAIGHSRHVVPSLSARTGGELPKAEEHAVPKRIFRRRFRRVVERRTVAWTLAAVLRLASAVPSALHFNNKMIG